jgi:hypothetical protein
VACSTEFSLISVTYMNRVCDIYVLCLLFTCVVFLVYMPCVVFMTYICLMSVIYICVCRVRDIYALCCVYYMSGACDKYALCCVRNTLMRLDILQNCSCVFVGAGMWVV